MLRSFSVEQPCCSSFEVHLQALLRTFLRPLLENSDTELFLDPTEIFETSLGNLMLQPVDCKPLTLVKREFLEISRRSTFSYITMHMMELMRELCRMQEYCYFSKKCSHHRRYSITFKIFCSRVTLTGKILGGTIFQYSCRQQIVQDKLRQKNLD